MYVYIETGLLKVNWLSWSSFDSRRPPAFPSKKLIHANELISEERRSSDRHRRSLANYANVYELHILSIRIDLVKLANKNGPCVAVVVVHFGFSALPSVTSLASEIQSNACRRRRNPHSEMKTNRNECVCVTCYNCHTECLFSKSSGHCGARKCSHEEEK